MNAGRAGRFALIILLAIYGFRLAKHPDMGSLMDSVDLPIHETGHLLFSPFGELMQFMGGTLFQVIMPTVFVVYFLRRGDKHGASVALWWVAQNFWNISVYVKDARNQDLDLVGGGEHDWAYILAHFGALKSDQIIGNRFWTFGVVLYVIAICGGLFALTAEPAKKDEAASDT